MKIDFKYNDGGRKAAGYKGETRDCVTRSIAIATGKPYQEVYDSLNELSKEKKLGFRKVKTFYGTSFEKASASRTGVVRKVYDKYLKSLGWNWTATMLVGQGCKVHIRADELPTGRLIVRVSKHITTVIDGVIHDTFDCSRDGTRCVYGYYSLKTEIMITKKTSADDKLTAVEKKSSSKTKEAKKETVILTSLSEGASFKFQSGKLTYKIMTIIKKGKQIVGLELEDEQKRLCNATHIKTLESQVVLV